MRVSGLCASGRLGIMEAARVSLSMVGVPFSPCGDTTAAPTVNPACNSAASAWVPLAITSLYHSGCHASGNSAVLTPAIGTFGAAGRNTLHDAPFRNERLSLQKNWRFKERRSAQCRAKFMNVLATQAAEKVAQPLLAVRFSRLIASRMRERSENHTARSGCATKTFPGSIFSATCTANSSPGRVVGNQGLGSWSRRDVRMSVN